MLYNILITNKSPHRIREAETPLKAPLMPLQMRSAVFYMQKNNVMEKKTNYVVSLSQKEKEALEEIISFEETLNLDIVCTMQVIADYYLRSPLDNDGDCAKKAMDQIYFLSQVRQIVENILPVCDQIIKQVGTVDNIK